MAELITFQDQVTSFVQCYFFTFQRTINFEYVLSRHKNSLSTGDWNSRALMGCFIAIINFNLKFHFQLISLFIEKKRQNNSISVGDPNIKRGLL